MFYTEALELEMIDDNRVIYKKYYSTTNALTAAMNKIMPKNKLIASNHRFLILLIVTILVYVMDNVLIFMHLFFVA